MIMRINNTGFSLALFNLRCAKYRRMPRLLAVAALVLRLVGLLGSLIIAHGMLSGTPGNETRAHGINFLSALALRMPMFDELVSSPNPNLRCRWAKQLDEERFATPLTLPAGFAPSEADCYEIKLNEGDFARVAIEQRGIDLAAEIWGPNESFPSPKKLLAIVDRPNLRFGLESISWTARDSGAYILKIYPLAKADSTAEYSLIDIKVHAMRPQDETRIQAESLIYSAERLRGEGEKLQTDSHRRKLGQALSEFNQARGLWRTIIETGTEEEIGYEIAISTFGIGLCHRALGKFAQAATDFQDALVEFSHVKHPLARHTEAAVNVNLARCLLNLGDANAAYESFSKARNAYGQFNDKNGIAAANRGMGDAKSAMNNYEEAEKTLLEASGDSSANPEPHARNLTSLGRLYLRQGKFAEAAEKLEEARESLKQQGGNEGYVLMLLGRAYYGLNDNQKAIESLNRAIGMAIRAGDVASELSSRYQLAWIKRKEGDLFMARIQAQNMLSALGRLNQAEAQQNLRALHFNSTREMREFVISLLMQMNQKRPNADFLAEAFEISESMHAMRLLESLSQSRVNRRTRPEETHGYLPAPYKARTLQHSLEADTALLEYVIGAEGAFLLVVDRAAIRAFTLHSVDGTESVRQAVETEISRPAQSVIEMLTGSVASIRQFEERATALSRVLLPNTARLTKYRKLLIVADGPLQGLPFAALTLSANRRPYTPLFATHTLTHLPSLTTVVMARRQIAGRMPAPHTLLALADPVIDCNDARFNELVSGAGFGNRASDPPIPDKHDDHFAFDSMQREAEILKSLEPTAVIKTGFDANLRQINSEELSRYRILHFASHAEPHEKNSSEMGIVLSQYDRQGRPIDGFLSASRIFELQVNAELVDLSVCESSLGKGSAGEWMGGLSTAFVRAGARAVLATLWKVRGRAANELTRQFYLAYLKSKLSPSAALRVAQSTMRKNGDYAPAEYLGFAVYGDWVANR